MLRHVWLLVAALGMAFAQEYRGLSLSTPYPAQTVRIDKSITLPLTVKSYGLPPQTVTLRVTTIPDGWKATLLGNGRPIEAVFLEPDGTAEVSLKLEPPADATPGTYRFTVEATGSGARSTLPITLTLGEVLPPQLNLEVELPVLKGTPTTNFRYRATLKNESDQDLLVNLEALAPEGFQVSFKPAFGSQEVTSLPVKAGESRRLDIEVDLPPQVPADTYTVRVRASAGEAAAEVPLTLEVTGRPRISLSTPEGRLSGRATAGQETPIKLVVRNRGTAPAREVELTAFEPSGWEVNFEPKKIPEIPPGEEVTVTAKIKPSSRSLAGDYMVTLRASGKGVSDSVDFRVTVLTSTAWGIIGVGLIAVALGVVGFSVARFGRR